jgi:hypothetical protein
MSMTLCFHKESLATKHGRHFFALALLRCHSLLVGMITSYDLMTGDSPSDLMTAQPYDQMRNDQ